MLQILAALLRDAFYDALRTQQQLGYTVSCFPDKFEGHSAAVLRCVVLVFGVHFVPEIPEADRKE